MHRDASHAGQNVSTRRSENIRAHPLKELTKPPDVWAVSSSAVPNNECYKLEVVTLNMLDIAFPRASNSQDEAADCDSGQLVPQPVNGAGTE